MDGLPPHHVKQPICTNRPLYREGREQKAVKTYTVSSESKYLMIYGVPVNRGPDLAPLFSIHGKIEELRGIGEYSKKEEFTEVFLLKYKHIQSARYAKRKMDDLSFFGGFLHVCYGPEYETVEETRQKLQDRRKIIALKTKKHEEESRSHKVKLNTLVEDGADSIKKAAPSQLFQYQQQQQCGQEPLATVHNTPSVTLPCLNVPPPNLSLPPPSLLPPPPPLMSSSQSPMFSLPPPPPPSLTNDFQGSSNGSGSYTSPCLQIPLPQTPYYSNTTMATEKLWLEPPPQYCSSTLSHNINSSNTCFARVPSAQATFPPNFDARLPSAESTFPPKFKARDFSVQTTSITKFEARTNIGSDSVKLFPRQAKVKLVSDINKSQVNDKHSHKLTGPPKTSTSSSSIVLSKDRSNVVIREFKKSTCPRFIPRQAAVCSKTDQKKDGLNKAIRSSALILGDVQGAERPHHLVPLDKDIQKSIDETRKEIRKRVLQFSDSKLTEVVPKSTKTS